jgi:hypothetical protein
LNNQIHKEKDKLTKKIASKKGTKNLKQKINELETDRTETNEHILTRTKRKQEYETSLCKMNLNLAETKKRHLEFNSKQHLLIDQHRQEIRSLQQTIKRNSDAIDLLAIQMFNNLRTKKQDSRHKLLETRFNALIDEYIMRTPESANL